MDDTVYMGSFLVLVVLSHSNRPLYLPIAGPALLQAIRARLVGLPILTSRGEGAPEGSKGPPLHGDCMPRHEEGEAGRTSKRVDAFFADRAWIFGRA